MIKKAFLTMVAVGSSLSFAAEFDQQRVMEQLQALQRQVMEQQAEMNSMKARMSDYGDLVRGEVESAIDARGLAQVREVGPVISMRSNIEGLKLQGDVRFRAQQQKRNWVDGDSRTRYRTRFRLGAIWQTSEGWEIGAGLATGSSDGKAAQHTWSSSGPFDSMSIWLDYAYARHSWDVANLSLTIGQHRNPFVTSGVFWKGDLRPVGVTVQAGEAGFFGTAGVYDVLYQGSRTNAALVAAQLGYKTDFEGVNMTVAGSYYHYNTPTMNIYMPGNPDYDFHIGDLYAKIGAKVGEVGLDAYGHVWKNFGAGGPAGSGQLAIASRPDDEDLGWVAGIGAKFQGFGLNYYYAYVEADSAPEFFVYLGDDVRLPETNAKGHGVSLSYALTKNMSIGAAYNNLRQVVGTRKGEDYKLNFNYRF